MNKQALLQDGPWKWDQSTANLTAGLWKQLASFCLLWREILFFFLVRAFSHLQTHWLGLIPISSRCHSLAEVGPMCAPRRLTSLRYKFRSRRATYIIGQGTRVGVSAGSFHWHKMIRVQDFQPLHLNHKQRGSCLSYIKSDSKISCLGSGGSIFPVPLATAKWLLIVLNS